MARTVSQASRQCGIHLVSISRTCCDVGVGGSSQPLARFFFRLSFFFWFFVSAPLPVACSAEVDGIRTNLADRCTPATCILTICGPVQVGGHVVMCMQTQSGGEQHACAAAGGAAAGGAAAAAAAQGTAAAAGESPGEGRRRSASVSITFSGFRSVWMMPQRRWM